MLGTGDKAIPPALCEHETARGLVVRRQEAVQGPEVCRPTGEPGQVGGQLRGWADAGPRRHTVAGTGDLVTQHPELRGADLRPGLEPQSLAAAAGIGVRTLRDIEQDRVTRPHAASVGRLLAALQVSDDAAAHLLAAPAAPAAGRQARGIRIGVLGPLRLVRDGADVPTVPLTHSPAPPPVRPRRCAGGASPSGSSSPPDRAPPPRRCPAAATSLMLKIRGWVEDGGPDGEQLYCLADLLRTRFDADAALAAAAARVVVRDGSALAALDLLARLQAANGRTGAAAWCREAAAALRSTRSVGGGRSRVLSSRLGWLRR